VYFDSEKKSGNFSISASATCIEAVVLRTTGAAYMEINGSLRLRSDSARKWMNGKSVAKIGVRIVLLKR